MEEARQHSAVGRAGTGGMRSARWLIVATCLLGGEIALSTFVYYFYSYERGEYHWTFAEFVAAGTVWIDRRIGPLPLDVAIVLAPVLLTGLTRSAALRVAVASWLASLCLLLGASVSPGVSIGDVSLVPIAFWWERIGFTFCLMGTLVVGGRRLFALMRSSI